MRVGSRAVMYRPLAASRMVSPKDQRCVSASGATIATVDEQTAALAAAAVLRSAQKRSDFRPFTAANPCRA